MSEIPAAGFPSDYTTVVELLAVLAEEGYDGNFVATDSGMVRCPDCRIESAPETFELHGLHRLEGASDPDDMQAVLALTCPKCGRRGAAVVHYGPDSTIGEVAVLLAVEDRR